METEVLQIISNVGFPIAAFLLMYYQSTTVLKDVTAALQKIEVTLTSLNNRLEKIESDIDKG